MELGSPELYCKILQYEKAQGINKKTLVNASSYLFVGYSGALQGG